MFVINLYAPKGKKKRKKIPQSSEKREFVQNQNVLGNVHYTSLLVDSQVH